MQLRTAHPEDLDFIFAQEAGTEFQKFIFSSSREQHQQNLNLQNWQYFIFQKDESLEQEYFQQLSKKN